ncbi:hypothetical protein V5H98_15790 [Georgenia sp. M64]|uniref:hypothetical protein n=1 Tax=Georgenia sp. M64 TaxID=3120520 RepID=UPI0030E3C760
MSEQPTQTEDPGADGAPAESGAHTAPEREHYDVFDQLMDAVAAGDLTQDAAIAIYRDLKPVAVQEVIPGTPHRHELIANTGEEWCIDCGGPARACPVGNGAPTEGEEQPSANDPFVAE